jgi:outer membrane protein OmpA-like peptidoglycan-associated protein
MMNRRLLVAALGTALSLPVLAQSGEADAPVTKSAKILDALAPKDIVLDAQGRPTRPRADPAINLTVQFGFDSAELQPQGKRQLDELAAAFGDPRLANARFEVGGHTDRVGDAPYNLRLSMDRAMAVRDYLMQVHGLSGQRLSAMGYGFDRLLLPTQPTAAANRRVEVRRILSAGAVPTPAAEPLQPQQQQPRLVPTPR